MALPGLEFLGGLGIGSSKDKKKIFGSKPIIPQYPKLEETLGGALTANQKLLPQATELSQSLTKANLDAFLMQMEQLLPGYGKAAGTIMDTLQRQFTGDLGVDRDVVWNQGAAKSLGLGIGGSESGRALVARDIGRKAYEVQQQAFNQFNQLTATQAGIAPRPITPGAFLADPAMAERYSQNLYQRNLLAAGVAAAPDPVARGVVDQQMATIGMVLSIYGGGAGYQNTYRPSYPGGGVGGGGGGGGGPTYGGPSTSGYNYAQPGYTFQPQGGYTAPDTWNTPIY